MDSPFIITDLENKKFTVSWPKHADIRGVDAGIKLLNVLFGELKNNDIGLVIKLNNDEVDIMWIEFSAWAQTPDIDRYMHDYYDIAGVAFNQLSSAERFKEWLEKKLGWKILHE